MSNKNNDAHLEEMAEAEQDIKDCHEAYINACDELDNAVAWHKKMRLNYEQANARLVVLKNIEF